MEISVKELSSIQREVTVKIPANKIDTTLNNLYNRLARTAKIKGFRTGKIPRFILEKYYKTQVITETIEKIINEYYINALNKANLDPVSQPDFTFDTPKVGQEYTFKMILDIKPIFNLNPDEYKNLKLKEPNLLPDKKEINRRLDIIKNHQPIIISKKNQPAKINDIIIIDSQAYIDEKCINENNINNLEIELGNGQTQQEIERSLIDSKIGDIIEVIIKYDDNAPNKKFKNKKVLFKLKIKAIKEKILPKIDDNFARSVSTKFNSLQDLKDYLSQELSESFQQQRNIILRNQILDQIQKLGNFDLPTSLVKKEINNMVTEFKTRLRNSGIELNHVNLENSKLTKEFKIDAEKKVRTGFILNKIAEQEKINISTLELNNEITKIAKKLNQSIESIQKKYKNNDMISLVSSRLLEEKILQNIMANAIIEIKEPIDLDYLIKN